jgi:hypothetical protein
MEILLTGAGRPASSRAAARWESGPAGQATQAAGLSRLNPVRCAAPDACCARCARRSPPPLRAGCLLSESLHRREEPVAPGRVFGHRGRLGCSSSRSSGRAWPAAPPANR